MRQLDIPADFFHFCSLELLNIQGLHLQHDGGQSRRHPSLLNKNENLPKLRELMIRSGSDYTVGEPLLNMHRFHGYKNLTHFFKWNA